LVDFGAAGGEGVAGGEFLAGAGVDPDLGPVFGPMAFGIDGGVGREDGAVEGFVGQRQLGGTLVVQIRQRAFFEAGVFGGGGHDSG